MEEIQILWTVIVGMAEKMGKDDVAHFFRKILDEIPQLSNEIVQAVIELEIGPMISHLAYRASGLSIKSAEFLVDNIDKSSVDTEYYTRLIYLAESHTVRAVALAKLMERIRNMGNEEGLRKLIEDLAAHINTQVASINKDEQERG